jgi:hypothetical protein
MIPMISVVKKGVSKHTYISFTHYYRKPEDRVDLDWSGGVIWNLDNFETHRYVGPNGTSK